AKGVIIESQLSSQKGPLATVLVQTGTLKIGDTFVSGLTYGKVRAMIDDFGRQVKFAPPSTPIEVLGFSALPVVGEKFIVVGSEQFAKEIVAKRQEILLREKKTTPRRISLEDLSYKKVKQLNVIIKTDFLGSLHAIRDALERFSLEEVKLNIVHSGVGAINLSDVNLSVATSSIIIGFNVRPDPKTEEFAKSEGVEIRTYRVIYELMDDIKKALEGLLEPKKEERIIGHAEIKKIFTISDVGTVAGCLVTDGKVVRSEKTRLLRDNVIIFDGAIKSLKRFKDDVKEVERGYECGILLENFNDIKVGDILEFYTVEIIK
ncbi:MAG: translation initiation factor IF-2, partial [Elusimicrobiota bacterium]|nr:translation initiation factor IF-2 [Elusimicrobiota bacterium]